LYSLAGSRYDPSRASETAYQQAWLAFQEIQGLFEPSTPALSNVRPQRSLARYLRSSDAVRTLVRRHGIRRADRPQEPFVINILVDGKQDTANTKFRPSAHLPFAFATPS